MAVFLFFLLFFFPYVNSKNNLYFCTVFLTILKGKSQNECNNLIDKKH
jgi:hypothetical protein